MTGSEYVSGAYHIMENVTNFAFKLSYWIIYLDLYALMRYNYLYNEYTMVGAILSVVAFDLDLIER